MSPSKLLAGASGYSYKEWKGDFYPADIKTERFGMSSAVSSPKRNSLELT